MKLTTRRARHAATVLVLAAGIPLPTILALGRVTGHPFVVAGLAAALLAPFVAGLRSLWEHRPRSRIHLYGVLWPFFIWWTFCLVFLGLAPVGLLVAWLARVPLGAALAWTLVAAGLGAARALSRRPRVCELAVPVPGLPAAFDGYRIAQISDIHCGPFTPPARVRSWVERVNALAPDLVAVTGDSITSGADYVPAVAACLGALRAGDGVFGCMGNHDYFTDGEAFARELQRRGLPLLRNRGVIIERGGAQIYLCGVDDTWSRRDDLARALRGRPARVPTVLLAHDPALFPEAATHGVALTLSGHTHGGQFALPIAPRRWNLARLMTPFSSGLYRMGSSVVYVNRGLGTTGPPVRLGARPDIAVLTLRAANPDRSLRIDHVAEDVILDASDSR